MRLTVLAIVLALWWLYPCPVQPVPDEQCRVAPVEIKKAIYRMGPGYRYRMVEDRLEVERDGRWLRLRYGEGKP